jgi:hypothetical protein
MKIQIDLKSALCGLVIGIVAMFTIGAGISFPEAVGRYHLAANGAAFGLIDTVTGKVWMIGNSTSIQLHNDGDFFDPKQGK